ncbi:TonB-dependent receptor [Oceanobacter mangrovi]|uniref:TonB-dependent receptor n=1 Tax=Oceanobacter mangrovi TaxID=2862510 RepID=UPI001C8DE92C|nr:TonB-dependent receptor [Oceanobacter mangrovi]
MNKPKKHPLALAVTLTTLAMASTAVHAEEEQVIEEVVAVASPIRDSQEAAVEAKRNADNSMEVISADTIGRFPDQNLADSLGRLPGLAIERDQGQARYINFRGAPFRYTKIAINGIDIPGAEDGRTPRFDSFPAAITSRLEASKAILPSMPGEAVAGYINVETFDPFSVEGFGASVDVAKGVQELGDGDVSKRSLRLSWSGEKIGVVAFMSKNSVDQITDNREYDLERTDDGQLQVNELDFRSYKVTRENKAQGGSIEYRPGNGGVIQRLHLSTLYSEFVDYEQRNQFVFDMGESVGTAADNVTIGVSRMLEDGTYKTSTRSHTIGADLLAGGWTLTPSFTLTKTRQDMFLPIISSGGGSTTGSYDLSDIEDPNLQLDDNLSDIAYAYSYGMPYAMQMHIDEHKFKLDSSKDITLLNQPATLALGAQYDKREARGFTGSYTLDFTTIAAVDIDSFNTGKAWDSNTTNTIGGTYYNNTALRKAWEAAGAYGNFAVSDTNKVAIDEEVMAAYAMATTEMGWGNFTVGARVEQTDYSSSGTMNGEKIEAEDTFTNVLPSLHVNVNVSDELMWRGSATSAISRPNYNEWRASIGTDVTEKTATGGNPNLKFEESNGIDTSLEWYFAPASLASVSAFYRAIDNVIYASTRTVDGGEFIAAEAGNDWKYTSYFNGSDGKMQGLELNFMGALESGFGMSLNAAFINSEFKDKDGNKFDLPGTSSSIYNASVFYENYGFSARLNYMYRDEWISPLEDPSEVWGEQQRVDLTMSYELPFSLQGEQSSVYFNGNNLSNETDNRYAGNGTINQSESYGRSYLVGLRVNY